MCIHECISCAYVNLFLECICACIVCIVCMSTYDECIVCIGPGKHFECMHVYVYMSMYVYVCACIGMYLYVYDAFLHHKCTCPGPEAAPSHCMYVHVLNVLNESYVCACMLYVLYASAQASADAITTGLKHPRGATHGRRQVLLNLLVAMLSNTFKASNKDAQQGWKLHRARVLVSIDRSMTEAQCTAPDKVFWQTAPRARRGGEEVPPALAQRAHGLLGTEGCWGQRAAGDRGLLGTEGPPLVASRPAVACVTAFRFPADWRGRDLNARSVIACMPPRACLRRGGCPPSPRPHLPTRSRHARGGCRPPPPLLRTRAQAACPH
jgi:hypothetical protein